jgi:hypothetical protein
MYGEDISTVLIVGAGFSHHAGLPLTSEFTDAVLAARDFRSGPSRIIVDFLTEFIYDAFAVPRRASAERWPDLEDIFTCLDLSANTGHHLGGSFAPADLRTVRRALLSRIIRMLNQKYEAARKGKAPPWRALDSFFSQLDLQRTGFISMNWDTVIERKLALISPLAVDYGCDAIAAGVPDVPDRESFRYKRDYDRALLESRVINFSESKKERENANRRSTVVKIHGSANWLYCDNCRAVFWLHPDQWQKIADQLIRADDLSRIESFLRARKKLPTDRIGGNRDRVQLNCRCSEGAALGTRIATFSYRKALEFPMFQKSWAAAEALLQAAKKWVFIGYSLPAADYEFKYLLKRIQLSRQEQPEILVVSGGGKRQVHSTYENYRKFFGSNVKQRRFFSSGLTAEAVGAICR